MVGAASPAPECRGAAAGHRWRAAALGTAGTVGSITVFLLPVLDLTDFKRDLSELTDRLGHAQDCL